jgi:hypothetical protein
MITNSALRDDPECPAAIQNTNPKLLPVIGGKMAAGVIALHSWRAEFYQTMAATERVGLDVACRHVTHGVSLRRQWSLVRPFRELKHSTRNLVTLLAQLETYPSALLLEEDAAKIPQALRDLFRRMCAVLQSAESEGLHKSFFLRNYIDVLSKLGQEIVGFADRFEDAQVKLCSRAAAEEVSHYQEALEAYRSCDLRTEQATEEDVKTRILHL